MLLPHCQNELAGHTRLANAHLTTVAEQAGQSLHLPCHCQIDVGTRSNKHTDPPGFVPCSTSSNRSQRGSLPADDRHILVEVAEKTASAIVAASNYLKTGHAWR